MVERLGSALVGRTEQQKARLDVDEKSEGRGAYLFCDFLAKGREGKRDNGNRPIRQLCVCTQQSPPSAYRRGCIQFLLRLCARDAFFLQKPSHGSDRERFWSDVADSAGGTFLLYTTSRVE